MTLTPEQQEYLYRGARADEVFFVQDNEPKMRTWGWWSGLYRRVEWDCNFYSSIALWFIRWYRVRPGGTKCDGTRSWVWNGRWPGFVMTRTPKEMLSVRLRWRSPDRERWNNMGGI